MDNIKESSIKIHNLSISFESGLQSTDVCQQFNLQIKSGEIVGLLGPNGSGKSSLINAILGEIRYSGSISFKNYPQKKPKIAYVPQDYKSSFFSWTSLKNNIRFTQENTFKNWNALGHYVDEKKEDLGIKFSLSINPKNCSGGMLQQAAILRSLCSQQGIILADEPFSALDVNINSTIRKSFRAIVKREGIACLVILHSMEDILAFCDRLIVIPNKPYTSIEGLDDLFRVKEFRNDKVTSSHESNSLLEIASKVLQAR